MTVFLLGLAPAYNVRLLLSGVAVVVIENSEFCSGMVPGGDGQKYQKSNHNILQKWPNKVKRKVHVG